MCVIITVAVAMANSCILLQRKGWKVCGVSPGYQVAKQRMLKFMLLCVMKFLLVANGYRITH